MNRLEEVQVPLINGLPDDIALLCLARVPRLYHTVMKCVSRRWRDLICSEEWCDHRRNHNLQETWIYALCQGKLGQVFCYVMDPNSSRSWKRIHKHPPHIFKRKGMAFEALGNKLYLLGGCSWAEDATNEAYCYNASMNSWLGAPCLLIGRCYFASEVLDGKIYAFGGLGLESGAQHSWETFEPQTNTWKSDSNPDMVLEIEDSFVLDGKIYLRCAKFTATNHAYALVYEPSSGTWQAADSDMVSGWKGPAAVAGSTLYVLDESSGITLTMWSKVHRKWLRIGRLSPRLIKAPCRLVANGNNIFILGRGGSGAVIDVSNAGSRDVAIACSSIPGISEDAFDVISCKCLAI